MSEARKTADEILKRLLEEAHQKIHPGANINPDEIMNWILKILEAIRECRNPAMAKWHMLNGTTVAVASARKALRNGGYRGNALRFARAVVASASKATEEEADTVLDEAADMPEPPPSAGGFWPVVASVCLLAVLTLGFPGMAYAGSVGGNGVGSGWWPQAEQVDQPVAKNLAQTQREEAKQAVREIGMWPTSHNSGQESVKVAGFFPTGDEHQKPKPEPGNPRQPQATPEAHEAHEPPDLFSQIMAYNPPFSQEWTWPGGTHESLIRHMAAEIHGLPVQVVRGLPFRKLVEIHNSDHEGRLDRSIFFLPQQPREQQPRARVQTASYQEQPKAITKTVETRTVETQRLQPVVQSSDKRARYIRTSPFRRVRVEYPAVLSAGRFCPAGGCP